MKDSIKGFWIKLKKTARNTFVQKWFLALLAIVILLFACFMLYTQSNYEKALRTEYTSYAELQTERITESLDDSFRSFSRVGALLSLNDMVHIFLFGETPDALFSDIYGQLNTQLVSYTEGFPAIDSIYLFSANKNYVVVSNDQHPITMDTLKTLDRNCLTTENAPDSVEFVFREKNNRYPYLLTIYIPLREGNQTALIVMNINISKISLLQSSNSSSFQKIYIVSDNGEILFKDQQEDMPEPLDTVPELGHFDPSSETYSQYVDGDNPYIYAQMHSSTRPWYYITITAPQGYEGRSYDFYSSLLTIIPWLALLALIIIIWLVLLATHPIRTISDFLENPLTQIPNNISEPETKKIIHQFINYIQANQMLSDELKTQMQLQTQATFWALQSQINPHFLFNTLNIIRSMELESLGYDHEVPEMTLTLSRLLQYAIDSTELVPLKTEFYYTDLYLKILNKRHKDALHFEVTKSPDTSEVLVPKLILQPLIENAVFHGCSPQLEKSNQILVNAVTNEDMCVITIKDNGVGIPDDELMSLNQKLSDIKNIPSNSIGLQNVVFRLHLTYVEKFSIHIDSIQGEGTCITLSFPITY